MSRQAIRLSSRSKTAPRSNCVSTPRFRGLSLASFPSAQPALGCPVKPPGQARASVSTSTQWRSNMDTHVTTIETPARKAPPIPRNGVDTPKLFATIGAVASQPALAQFRFRAQSHWVGGTQSRTTIADFYGVGAEMQHDAPFQACADHPKVLCGEDNGTRSGRMGAARARSVPHRGHREHLRGSRRHTFIRWNAASKAISICKASSVCRTRSAMASRRSVSITRSRAMRPRRSCAQIVDQARARSAVFDILTGHVPVTIEVDV